MDHLLKPRLVLRWRKESVDDFSKRLNDLVRNLLYDCIGA